VSDAAGRDLTSALPPETAYAIRAWYTSVLSQTQQVRDDLESQVDRLQAEIERVEQQMGEFDNSIAALGAVLDTVDDWIRKLTEHEERTAKSSSARKGGRQSPSTHPGTRRSSAGPSTGPAGDE
jgi:hypothetical protein